MSSETIPHITETIPQITETIAQIEETMPEITETIPAITENLPQVTEAVEQVIDAIQDTGVANFQWMELVTVCMDWIEKHQIFLDIAISFLSFVVTTILTVVIIRQTSRLAKKQSEQELLINKQQEELQKRQIRIDTFDYKNSIYHALYKVFQMTGEIEVIFSKISLKEKTAEQLYQMFSILRDQLKIDVSETMWLFKQAEYILPPNIYDSVRAISKNFDELTGDVGKFELYPKILTEDELETEKQKLLEDISDRAKQINDHVYFITSVMPQELDISSLEK